MKQPIIYVLYVMHVHICTYVTGPRSEKSVYKLAMFTLLWCSLPLINSLDFEYKSKKDFVASYFMNFLKDGARQWWRVTKC